MKKLNSTGLAHHVLIAIVVVISFASFGAYRVFFSSAATTATTSWDVVVYNWGSGERSPVYSSAGKRVSLGKDPNQSVVKRGSWKICDNVAWFSDPCKNIPTGTTNLCDIGLTHPLGEFPRKVCSLDDAYIVGR